MANLMQIKTSSANVTTIKIEDDVKEEGNVDAAEPSPSRDDGICELEHLRKLFIGGLARYTTEDGLREYYNQWGNVVDVVVMRDPATKRSRGFGFITYTKSNMVDKAQENRPHIIDGKTVEAKRALPRPERETREVNISVKKLFVGGLKDNHDEESLHDYFSEFGKVISVKILSDKTTGKRRGFAFIEFDDYDAVDKAILRKVHSIKYVIVDVKKSVYQEQKKRQFENGNGNVPHNGNGISNDNRPPHAPMGGAPPKYRPPPPHTMPSYQQPPPMHAGPPPPQNYNYWGPPQQAMPQQYGGYQQPPPPPWGYPPAPNGWNAGPPPPPAGPAPTWQPNQWGPPPTGPAPPGPSGSGMPPPNPNWNTPQVAPPMPQPPGASNVQPQQQVPHNFGTGYQQNYGGGPTKHNMNSNRMNPYNAPPNNNYAHNRPPVSGYGGSGYGNGIPGNPKPPGVAPPVNNGPPGTKPIPNSSGAGGSNYRR